MLLGRFWALWGRSWVALGAILGALGGVLGHAGRSWGALGALLGDFVLIFARFLFDFCSISGRFGNNFTRGCYPGVTTLVNFLNFQTSEH